jgi:hypothetical protein
VACTTPCIEDQQPEVVGRPDDLGLLVLDVIIPEHNALGCLRLYKGRLASEAVANTAGSVLRKDSTRPKALQMGSHWAR